LFKGYSNSQEEKALSVTRNTQTEFKKSVVSSESSRETKQSILKIESQNPITNIQSLKNLKYESPEIKYMEVHSPEPGPHTTLKERG
jgi:hypothetical protein